MMAETDLISRQAAIDAVKKNTFRLTFAEEQNGEGHVAWSANAVYSDVIEGALLELPSAQPERMTNRQWIDFLSAQFDISRTSAKEMLHGMMQWKKEDNFKKLFNGKKIQYKSVRRQQEIAECTKR